MMTTNLLKQTLYSVVDRSRANLSQPFRQTLTIDGLSTDYFCATNATVLILVPVLECPDYVDEDRIDNLMPPNIQKVIPDNIERKLLDVNFLGETYRSVPITTRYLTEICDSCDGNGTFIHYHRDYDCKLCNETGKIESTQQVTDRDPEKIICFRDKDVAINISLERIRLVLTLQNYLCVEKMWIIKMTSSILWLQVNNSYIAISGNYVDRTTDAEPMMVDLPIYYT